jgi:hypothetical protein
LVLVETQLHNQNLLATQFDLGYCLTYAHKWQGLTIEGIILEVFVINPSSSTSSSGSGSSSSFS